METFQERTLIDYSSQLVVNFFSFIGEIYNLKYTLSKRHFDENLIFKPTNHYTSHCLIQSLF